MEGFMESFIYLLITIVILVLSMKKKKQVEIPEDELEERPVDPFKDLFGTEEEDVAQQYDSYGEQEAVLRRYERMEQEVDSRLEKTAELERPNPWMTTEEADQMVLDSDAILREASENNPISELGVLEEEDAYEIGLSDDQEISFDLKKAVIYSEIIEKRSF